MEEMRVRIGKELRRLRQSHHLSLRAVADKYGKDNSTISKWETGDNNISAIDLIDYVEFYGVTIDEFFAAVVKKAD